MALLAYNKTTSKVTLAAGRPRPVLPPKTTSARGPAFNCTAELRGLTSGEGAAIQAQINAGTIEVEWTGEPEYPTPGLVIPGIDQHPLAILAYTNSNRPLPTVVDVGTLILNLTSGSLNHSNGTYWLDPLGNLA